MKIKEAIELELLSFKHRDELYSLVDTNRTYLREWLPWLDSNKSPDDTESFIKSAIDQYQAGKGPQYAVFHEVAMCGVCGFHHIDNGNKIGAIGYWLGQMYSGKGIMTKSVEALVKTGFREYKLNRIEITCRNWQYEKPKRFQSVWDLNLKVFCESVRIFTAKHVDHAVYSMLAAKFALNRVAGGF
ncbi:MAG: GNAT family N-acetyltransferase [Halioglobus sp.]|nr:GNAT family N-acetyltransferase [Halioglobus sp.]